MKNRKSVSFQLQSTLRGQVRGLEALSGITESNSLLGDMNDLI